jgi:hypothetical protein
VVEASGVSEGRAGAWSTLVARVRTWWDGSDFLGEVALWFTIITVGNSVMMVTGLDEPKTGSFAFVHLLGRFGIVVAVVGLFHLDEVGRWLRYRWDLTRPPGRPHPAGRPVRPERRSVAGFFLAGWLEGTARVFTTVVVATCVVAVAVAGVRPPAGGVGLYRNLVLFAVLLVPAMHVASRRWHDRTRPSPSDVHRAQPAVGSAVRLAPAR